MPQQQLTIQQAIDLAVQFYQAGRLQECESVCRQIVAAQPNHAEALHLLGILSVKAGRAESGVEFICNAIRANPRDPEFHHNLGQILAGMSPPRLLEAAAALRQAVTLRPQFAMAHYALGTTLTRMGKAYAHQAVESLENAVRAQPDLWIARLDLANALQSVNRLDDAIHILQQTLIAKPDYVAAHFNLGNMLVAAGRYAESAQAFREALSLQPDFFEAQVNLGFSLRETDHVDEAIEVLQKAVAMQPDSVEPWYHLGLAWAKQEHLGKLDQAIEAFEKYIAAKPDAFEAQNNLAVALARRGDVERAAEIYEKALSADPTSEAAKYNLSQIRLLQGDFARGWPLYESRWKVGDLGKLKLDFPQPRWESEDLAGKRILLYAEQGFGDAIHFARYAALVKQRGADSVILQVLSPLARLMRDVNGFDEVITDGDLVPSFDVHCPLLSLGLIFGTDLESIPASIPYIHADPQLSARWKERIETLNDEKALNVGLVWAGRSQHNFDRNRSMTLESFGPLAQVSGVRLFSLQKGDGADPAHVLPTGMTLIDWTRELNDFADTAALISNLDLVITVDTAVAHLAGAMGKPVWVLLPFAPDWRWMLNRTDSPWYPTMKLFRQPKAGEWQSPLQDVTQSLSSYVAAHRASA